MDKNEILRKLATRKPLFESIPHIGLPRIFGTESEYGIKMRFDDMPSIDYNLLPCVLPNGGEIYEDCGHVEYASPETSNPLSATLYYEAGKLISWAGQYSEELYCNNNDWNDHTFGSHENYFTRAPRSEWEKLIPFLIARTVMCGNGWFINNCRFEISQRARYIRFASSESTTSDRALINTRYEPLATVPGWDRLHLICGDATMSRMSTFLRLGTTSLIVEMLEKKALPNVDYNEHCVASDMQLMSQKFSDWHLSGIRNRPRGAVDLLSTYYERAKQIFARRDSVTDTLLAVWEDTLEHLGSNPMRLWRRLDWVTKFKILKEFSDEEKSCTEDWLRAQDMEYHNLDPQKGLFYLLQREGELEQLVSDELIIHAMTEPPSDTRAFLRGKIALHLAAEGGSRVICGNSWKKLAIVGRCVGIKRNHPEGLPYSYISQGIENPFQTYANLLEPLKKRLNAR